MMEQNGVCAICGRDPVWNGATLVFVLDSQLPTFTARNRGKGRHFRRERYRAWLSY